MTTSHTRRALKQSLLNLKNSLDKQRAVAVFVMVLRFMGDMQEPSASSGEKTGSVVKKIYDTFGRKSKPPKYVTVLL